MGKRSKKRRLFKWNWLSKIEIQNNLKNTAEEKRSKGMKRKDNACNAKKYKFTYIMHKNILLHQVP